MIQKKGTITSTKMTGTVTVTVDSHAFHPKYKKRYKVSRKFLADPAGQEVHEGDLVIISECKPMSKNKHFKVIEIIKKATKVDELVTEEAVEKAIHREKEAPPESVKEKDPEPSVDGTGSGQEDENDKEPTPEQS